MELSVYPSVNISFLLQVAFDDLGPFFDGHIAGVQAEIVVGSNVPGPAGVVTVVLAALFVCFFDAVDGGAAFQVSPLNTNSNTVRV